MAMVKVRDVAAELRRLAEAMERVGAAQAEGAVGAEVEIPQPWFTINCATKEQLQAVVAVLPRPLTKHTEQVITGYWKVYFNLPFTAIKAYVGIDRDQVCRLVAPAREAVWECEPVLAEGELDGVVGEAAADAEGGAR
jgi:hypothetical protein